MSSFREFTQNLFSRGAMGSPYTPRTGDIKKGRAVPPQAGKTNIHKSSSGGNDMMPIINNNYSTFKSIIDILPSFEYYHLTEKMLELIKDYVIRIVDYGTPIITMRGDGDEELMKKVTRINQILESLNFRNLLISNIDPLNYYGSISYAISYTQDPQTQLNKYKLSKLAKPHDVVIITKDKLKFYLVGKTPENNNISINNDVEMSTQVELLPEDKILYLGSGDFELKHDKSSISIIDNKFNKKGRAKKQVPKFGIDEYLEGEIRSKIESQELKTSHIDGTEVNEQITSAVNEAFNLKDPTQKAIFEGITSSEYNLMSSKPLYYSIHQKVKEYLIKDLILNVLGVKSSVQPSYLTWGIDSQYAYDITGLMELITTLEGRLNKSVDIDILNSSNMKMDTLVNRIMGNIRIIPDMGHNIRALEAKDIDDIIRKIDELSRRKAEVKDEILEASGFPRDLYEGASNREEVLKRDERFQSMILKMLTRLRTSVKSAVLTLAKLEGFELNENDFSVTMFKKSGIEYYFNTTKLDSIREMTNMLVTVFADTQQLLQFNLVSPDQLIDFLRTQLSTVGDEVANLVPTAEDVAKMNQNDNNN